METKIVIANNKNEEIDNVIKKIATEIYNVYENLLKASSCIKNIFSPGLDRINYLNDNISFESYHNEQFNNVFLKDEFIRVS